MTRLAPRLASLIVLVAMVAAVDGAVAAGLNGDRRLTIAASLIATTLVAAGFGRLRPRIERSARRLLVHSRYSRYELMTDLARTMADRLPVDDILPRLARTLGTALRADRCQVTVRLSGGAELVEQWVTSDQVIPLACSSAVRHSGETIGTVEVGWARGSAAGPVDAAYLTELATQVGPALRQVLLTADLRHRAVELRQQTEELSRSRRRLMSARDEERRRVQESVSRRVEHPLQELDPILADAATTVDRERDRVPALLAEGHRRALGGLDSLRDIATDVFPPVLAEQGLVPALESLAGRVDQPVNLQVTGHGESVRCTQEVEAALYFCCAELLSVAKEWGGLFGIDMEVIRRHDDWVVSVLRLPPPPDQGEREPFMHRLHDRLDAIGAHLEVRTDPAGTWAVSLRART